MESIILNAILMSFGFSALSGPLGSIMVWKRFAFFGDTIAHATLLGVAIAMMTHLKLTFVLLIMCVLLAVFLMMFVGQGYDKKEKPSDAKLAMMSHGALALGVIGLSFLKAPMSEFNAILFGDILTVSIEDLLYLSAFVAMFLIALTLFWKPLMTVFISEEIAISEGLPVKWLKSGFAICLGLAIALTLKIVGALLLTALFIIPPLTARNFATTPKQMMLYASGLTVIAFNLGLLASFFLDTPVGPCIVAMAMVIHVLSSVVKALFIRLTP